ncbi:U-box domain-containing protein 18-like [Lotus japonicus]|uniref:U-box domain-containing protein 18-like n=1 Tax=Lotus japonicus TaxID=34305 RepID=UPI002584E28C|nr:U-box domain-containing protein 18-like [Lotus japonicus]
MIRKLNGSDRRVLTFPVVYPGEDIAISTLLTSLISLSNSISTFQHTFFTGNKRNARNAIRLTQLLQPFLYEIRNHNPDLPDPVALCLSELHVTFQKLLFLLEDLTREGARLRMLMESERVAAEFRVVSRAVATALDIFPFGAVEVSEEAEEQVLLLMKQAREARFEVELDDERAVMGVMSILNQFENRVAPDEGELKRVIEYIGVCRWSECNREVKFLEGEIGFEGLNEEKKRKVSFLSSLMGFMSYCRCVVMEVVDGEEGNNKKSDASNESEMILSCVSSDDFLCPISLELMRDPVTIETGHTYDRSSILKWLKSGNATCPKTGKRLSSTELVPNLVLRRLVQQYCSVNGIPFADSGRRNRDITRTVQPGSVAAEEAMKMVSGFLCGRIENGRGEEKNRAAFEMRLLSKTSIFCRSCLVEAGSVPLLLILLSSSDSSAQENAIAALLNLSKYSKSRAQMVENWGLEFIVGVLNKGEKMEARQHAAAVLFYLASSNAEHGNKIGEEPEAIPSLIRLIEDGADRSQKNGLVAMFGLLKHPENVKRVITAGAVPLLVNILKTCEKDDIITDSLAILATIAERSDGTAAILKIGALDVAVEILSSSSASRMGMEHCVSLLLCLSLNGGGDVVAHLVKKASLMGPLYSQLSEGTSRGSKKASALIRVLHDFYERRSFGFKAPVIPREQFIHVW